MYIMMILHTSIKKFILILFYVLLPSLKRVDNIFKLEFLEEKQNT